MRRLFHAWAAQCMPLQLQAAAHRRLHRVRRATIAARARVTQVDLGPQRLSGNHLPPLSQEDLAIGPLALAQALGAAKCRCMEGSLNVSRHSFSGCRLAAGTAWRFVQSILNLPMPLNDFANEPRATVCFIHELSKHLIH